MHEVHALTWKKMVNKAHDKACVMYVATGNRDEYIYIYIYIYIEVQRVCQPSICHELAPTMTGTG
jgi:hypothetical protein